MTVSAEVEALMKQIAQDAANQAVSRTLLTYGIDPEFPVEFQKDMAHLREWRQRMEKVQEKSLMMVITLVILFFGSAVLVGLKAKFM